MPLDLLLVVFDSRLLLQLPAELLSAVLELLGDTLYNNMTS